MQTYRVQFHSAPQQGPGPESLLATLGWTNSVNSGPWCSIFKAPGIWQHTLIRYLAVLASALCFLFAAVALASNEWFMEKYDLHLKRQLGLFNFCTLGSTNCEQATMADLCYTVDVPCIRWQRLRGALGFLIAALVLYGIGFVLLVAQEITKLYFRWLAFGCMAFGVSFGIITTAAFTTVKHSWAKDLLGFNYLLYGRGYGCNIVSWIMGFFCMVVLFWPLVEEHPHVLSPYLPKVPPRPKKNPTTPIPVSPRTSPQDVSIA